MQISRNSLDTAAGPEDWFTGSVCACGRRVTGPIAQPPVCDGLFDPGRTSP